MTAATAAAGAIQVAGKYTLTRDLSGDNPRYTELHLLHHGDEHITQAGSLTVSHSRMDEPSWHNYHSSDLATELNDPHPNARAEDFYTKENPWGTTLTTRQPSRGQDRPLFVNQGGEGDPRESTLHYLRMDRKHVGALPTMLGAAQFAAHERGNVLKPSDDLSVHSVPLVEKLTGKQQTVSNDLHFMQSQFQHNDDYGKATAESLWGAPMSQPEYDSRRRAGRQTIGILRSQGRSAHFKNGVQGTLF